MTAVRIIVSDNNNFVEDLGTFMFPQVPRITETIFIELKGMFVATKVSYNFIKESRTCNEIVVVVEHK